MKNGVYVYQNYKELAEKGFITSKDPIKESQFQPATMDLRLGQTVYRISASRYPKKQNMQEILDKALYSFDISKAKGGVLDVGSKYIVKLKEEVDLSAKDDLVYGLRGYCNNKSSSGRLNLEAKLLTPLGYDVIPPGYKGPLYLELTPKSFPVTIYENVTVNQIRFISGDARINDTSLYSIYQTTPLCFNSDGTAISRKNVLVDNGISLSVGLEEFVGYKARNNVIEPIDMNKKNHYHPEDYFDELRLNKFKELILQEHNFYILSTKEYFRTPNNLASEMIAYDLTTAGQFRSHYAGFIDPGFGYGRGEVNGRPLTLEVIPHDTISISHDQIICKMIFEYLLDDPDKVYGVELESNYSNQNKPRLSKHFKVSD